MAGHDAPRRLSDRTPIALTIAGSDSGGGAGIQADLKTFAALGVYAASAVTALTAQNTLGVKSIHFAPPEIVAAQIEAVLEDFDVAAIKIGMLGNVGIVEAVAGCLSAARSPSPLAGEGGAPKERRMRGRAARRVVESPRSTAASTDRSSGTSGDLLPQGEKGRSPFVIYDPVMLASSGDSLSSHGFIDALKSHLLPLVDCLTPNLAEAAALLGEPIARDEAGMARQGRALRALGPRAVLMKGGHLDGADAIDLLVTLEETKRYAAPRIASRNLHGTGCALASAIAAAIVLGLPLAEAVARAKTFVGEAIERALDLDLGAGVGPLAQLPLSGVFTLSNAGRDNVGH